MNIRNFVSNDHIMSVNEIAQTQSMAIQAYMLENEQLQRELKEVYDKLTNKDKRISQLTNNWNELEEWVKEQRDYYDRNDEYSNFRVYADELDDVLDKMKEIKNGDNND